MTQLNKKLFIRMEKYFSQNSWTDRRRILIDKTYNGLSIYMFITMSVSGSMQTIYDIFEY